MAATEFQASILKRVARSRLDGGQSYVAGGLALNVALGTPRLSHDIDIFNDTVEAVASAFTRDTAILRDAGYEVIPKRQYDNFREAVVLQGENFTTIQWAYDSAYRFFPLVEDPLLGLVLHPFDLATNKVLALIGRREPRDFVDVLNSHDVMQPLPYLAWAACGKDPGFNPAFLIDFAARTRYNQVELDQEVDTLGHLDAAALMRKWHEMIWAARETITILPPEEAGKCVANADGTLFRGSDDELRAALDADRIVFHEGCIHGAWPRVVES
ncbi:MAG: nucleotidyl transferase AbiEii/AbiGii toxin family protein [Kiritimatiellae bacterium]|nr:nucleotidyl transferase AbiEii/AbiGii toxin family protein [Kiritimatiellia bacterium]